MSKHTVLHTSPSWCHTGYRTGISLRSGASLLEITSRLPCCLSASVLTRTLEPNPFVRGSLPLTLFDFVMEVEGVCKIWMNDCTFCIHLSQHFHLQKKNKEKNVCLLLSSVIPRYFPCLQNRKLSSCTSHADWQTDADHQLADHLTQTKVRSPGGVSGISHFLSDDEKKCFSGKSIMTCFSILF